MNGHLLHTELQQHSASDLHHHLPTHNEDLMNASVSPHLDYTHCTENDSNSFCNGHAVRNNTQVKSLLSDSSASAKKLIFLVYENESDSCFREILGNFADVMRGLSGIDVTVKLDFECQEENQRDVKAWAEGTLKLCTNVVIVLSESFKEICRSYLGSKAMEVGSCSAYRDIAPLVMERLIYEEGFGHTIFVHFGLEEAEQVFGELLELYLSPHRYLLQGELSPDLAGGQPASTPALPLHARSTPASSPGCALVITAQSGSAGHHASTFSSAALSSTMTGSDCSPGLYPGQSPPPYSRDDDGAVLRHSYEVASGHEHCIPSRGRHQSAPAGSALCPPPYEAACSSSSPYSASSQTAKHSHHPPVNINVNVANSADVQSYIGSHHQPSYPADLCAPLPNRGQGPKLIRLMREQDLKVFLQELGLGERSIDEAVRGRHAQTFFHNIEKRFNDRNPQEPVQHSCCSSPAGSHTNLSNASLWAELMEPVISACINSHAGNIPSEETNKY